jgi:hypothetical protein
METHTQPDTRRLRQSALQTPSETVRPDQREIELLRRQVATLRVELEGKEKKLHQESARVAALNLEVIQTRMAADREFKLKTEVTLMHL